MVNQNLLNVVMFVEIALLVLAVAVFFGHGLWLFLNHRRVMRLTETARQSLARLVTRGTINVEDVELSGIDSTLGLQVFMMGASRT